MILNTISLPYKVKTKKFNKNRWLESLLGRQKGRPKNAQKMHNPQESKKEQS
jgi:hypothetical protein